MRALICADIHANLEALEAVLELARQEAVDHLVVLGDLVGYGGAPGEVLARLQAWDGPLTLLRGNHDKVVAGLADATDFNELARASAEWTRAQLDDAQLAFVRELPMGPLALDACGMLCHGTPFDEDVYLFSPTEAKQAFDATEASLTFFGHTHLACFFLERRGRVGAYLVRGEDSRLDLEEETRYLVNPGSVGQPRDGDPRAACILFDSARGHLTWQRLEYPVERAQRRILDAGLPAPLAERLAVGG
ncbi:MAG: metallophosphoesterase family protein [Thermoanaerobaculia bacterium]